MVGSQIIGCLLAASIAAYATVADAQTNKSGNIVLGAILSLTGAAAPYGEDNRRGLELAAETINGEGGINGRKVVLDIQDFSGDDAQAVSLSRRFADNLAMLAVLGPTRTGEAVAVARILPELRIPMMSVGSTGDWRTAAGDFNTWTFRSTRVDTYLIEPLLRVARDRFGIRTAAILSTANDDYAVSVLPIYKQAAAKLGIRIVADERQMAGDTDRSPQLTKIRATNPDVLIINALSSDAPSIAQQARRIGLRARFVGTAGFSNPATWKLAASGMLDGTLVADNYFVGSARPVVGRFVQRYRAKFGGDPPAYAAYGFDGLLLVADAMRRAGSTPTRTAVRDELAKTKDFEGVLGKLSYNGSGDAQKSAVILMISNGNYQLVQ